MRIVKPLLCALGAVGLLCFLAPFATASSLNIGNATGLLLSLCLLCLGIFYEPFCAWLSRMFKHRLGRVLIMSVAVILAVIFCLAVFCTALMVSGAAQPPEEGATLVVLGCRVYGTRAGRMLSERIDAAEAYLRAHPETHAVLSGGRGEGEDISEAECMYRALVARGIAPSRLFREQASTSTRENLAFSHELILREGLNAHLAIATNEFHCWRALKVAQGLGLDAGCVPAPTAFYLFPTYYVRELWGILYELCF